MNVQVASSGDFSIVSVEGRIDTTNANEFEKAMMSVVESGSSKIVLNCTGLSYISSSGLRIFLIVQKKMMATKGLLRICNLQPVIKEVFDISGFSTIFSIFPDQDSAMNA